MEQVHGTCIEVEGTAVLLRGPPGSGKSDLALRLIESGARLVADDRADIGLKDERLVVSPPPAIAGLLEVNGHGVFKLGFLAESPLGLVVNLVSEDEVERLPEPRSWECLGVSVPVIDLAPFHASSTVKIRLAVRWLAGDVVRVP